MIEYEFSQTKHNVMKVIQKTKTFLELRKSRVDVKVFTGEFPATYKGMLPLWLADITQIAAAIYVCDRLTANKKDTARNIHISLPLYMPDIARRKEISSKLYEVLDWLTYDNWSFEFRQREKPIEDIVYQQSFFPIEVCLWSGGLDATVGLLNRIVEDADKQFVLLGSGSNKSVLGLQTRVLDEIMQVLKIKLQLHQPHIQPKYFSSFQKNKVCRTRGLLFCLIGSVCACLLGQNRLYLYENGIGAINLPYTNSQLGADMSKAVHPISLGLLSDFVSLYSNQAFEIINPFLYSTKAEMCKILSDNRFTEIASVTSSCDRSLRKLGSKQCGRCTSCILRRQALLAANTLDETGYVYQIDTQHLHYRAMAHQVNQLNSVLRTEEADKALAETFPNILEVADYLSVRQQITYSESMSSFLQLYQNYVQEWNDISNRWGQVA